MASSEGGKAGGIARASGVMMVMVLLSRILGVVRDAIISHYFGRGPQTDAYNAAFTVPDLLFYLLQGGALSSTIVPIITEMRQQGKAKAADALVNTVATTIFFVIGSLIVLMWIFAEPLTVKLNPGFDAARIALAVPLTRVLLPAQICFFLGGLLMGVLYSRKQFLVPALGPVIYNFGIICGGVFLHRWLGIQGLVWGAIAGAVLGNFLLPLVFVHKTGFKLRPNLAVMHPEARKVWRMLLPIVLGVSLPNIDQMVNKMFASFLGSGDTTAMMNAYRLMLLPIGVFAQAMALAAYPTLSEQAGRGDMKAMRDTMNRSLRNILFLTVPASALMVILAVPIITFLLQSGRYHAEDTLRTATALQALSLGIFAWSCQSLLTRGFYALQNSKVPVISGAIVSVIFVAMNYSVVRGLPELGQENGRLVRQVRALQSEIANLQPIQETGVVVQGQLGAAALQAPSPRPRPRRGEDDQPPAGSPLTQAQSGVDAIVARAQTVIQADQAAIAAAQARQAEIQAKIARQVEHGVRNLGLATTIAAAIHMFALLFLLRHRMRGIGGGRLAASVGKTLIATALLCVVTWVCLALTKTFLPVGLAPKLASTVTLLASALPGIGVYLLAAKLLKMDELASAVGMLRRKRGGA